MGVTTTELRRILGPTLQYVAGKLDVAGGFIADSIGAAISLATTGAPVQINGAAPPSAGDSLVATDAQHAHWAKTEAGSISTSDGPIAIDDAGGVAFDVLTLTGPNDAKWTQPLAIDVHVGRFVDVGEQLTSGNFEQALLDAITYAYAQPTGATIAIPSGTWPMTQAILLLAPTRDQGITLKGAGRYETFLQWPADFTGACVTIDGSSIDVDHENFYWGGICDLTIAGDYADCAATGLLITKAIMSQFRNIAIEGFLGTGGLGLDIELNEDATNSQNLLFDNVHICLNDQGSRWKAISGFTATHIHWNNNQTLDHEWAGFCSGTINGYMFQSGAIPSMETSNPNPGGNRITFLGQGYHEASTPFSPYLLKTLEPTDTDDWFDFGAGISANGYVQLFDLTGTGYLRLGHVTSSPETALWIKARNCGQITLDDAPDPILVPAAYDLDQYSALGLSTQRNALPYFGQTGRGESIEGLLRPKAIEGWDIGKRATLVLANSGTEVASAAGLIHGTVASPGAMGNPTFNPASKHSNYQAAVQLTENAVTGKGLKATLSTPVPIGTYVGIFVVMRCQDTGPAINLRGPFIYNSGTGENYGIGAADSTRTTEIYGQFVVGGTDRPIGPAAGQTVHAILIQPDQDKQNADSSVHDSLYVDNDTRIASGSTAQAPTTSTLANLWFAGIDNRSANLTIYELWFLNRNLAPGEISQLMDLAREKYGIPQTVTTATPQAAPAIVKGPSSSTAHALAAFSGTSGDQLEDTGIVLAAGMAAFLATSSSAFLKAAVTDETGSGALVFATSPTLVTPALGVPSSVDLTNGTALPIASGVSGLGTGVAAFLATPSSANLATALTDEEGAGKVVFAAVPTVLGTNLQATALATPTWAYPGDGKSLAADQNMAATTLANVTGLSWSLGVGTWAIDMAINLLVPTAGQVCSVALAFSGTKTAAPGQYTKLDAGTTIGNSILSSSSTDLTASQSVTVQSTTAPLNNTLYIKGHITVTVAGTLQLQMANVTNTQTVVIQAGSRGRCDAVQAV